MERWTELSFTAAFKRAVFDGWIGGHGSVGMGHSNRKVLNGYSATKKELYIF